MRLQQKKQQTRFPRESPADISQVACLRLLDRLAGDAGRKIFAGPISRASAPGEEDKEEEENAGSGGFDLQSGVREMGAERKEEKGPKGARKLATRDGGMGLIAAAPSRVAGDEGGPLYAPPPLYDCTRSTVAEGNVVPLEDSENGAALEQGRGAAAVLTNVMTYRELDDARHEHAFLGAGGGRCGDDAAGGMEGR